MQGCACKFLYGPGTDEDKKEAIEKALEAKDELQIEVQFYKKHGEFFSFIFFIFLGSLNFLIITSCQMMSEWLEMSRNEN